MAPALLIDRREHIIDDLTSGYANGQLELDDLERRLALVHAAETTSELDAIVTDLVPVATAALVPPQQLRVVMSSVDRRGPWSVPPQLATRVFCGNLVLDLREARLPATGTTIEVNVTMGNVEVIVPPDLGVEVDASSVLGNIEDRSERAGTPSATVRIIGRVTLGNLEIATLVRGETRRDARRRRRRALHD
jgi:Cell wall-active antibiotics response 4TMS YvqF/Domain of unknown function (DUF1707)